VAGLAFLVIVPTVPFFISLGGHTPELQKLEAIYLRCLCFAALPMLVMSAVNGFFSGRGQTWTVLGIEGFGTAVNVGLAMVLIFGRVGFPELGIEGAGLATAIGSWSAALLAIVLMTRRKYRSEYGTLSGWKPERELFGRLMKYGGPAGMQVFLDVLVFNMFTQLVGRISDAALGATTLAVRLNMIAFLPMMGLGQAVCILVGQGLGKNRPDLAEKTTYNGLRWMFGYMCLVALAYVTIPGVLLAVFEGDREPEKYMAIAALVPRLLLYVAVFSLADAINLSFAFALRGAGDTKFVTLLTFSLAWPLMVIPTFFVVTFGGSVYWAWVFVTAHIIAMSICFWFRFRSGKWKAMRVIEPEVAI
jgi:MATE family multidrug resistance protein